MLKMIEMRLVTGIPDGHMSLKTRLQYRDQPELYGSGIQAVWLNIPEVDFFKDFDKQDRVAFNPEWVGE